MPDLAVQKKIDEMVRRIVERFHPEEVILFGSYARGQAGPGSDVDLLVVMPVSGSRREMQLQVRLVLNDIRLPKDIIVVTPDQVEKQRDIPGTIVRPAFLEGRVLYAKAG
jgi:predicted nucleotidyltransferase